MKIINKKLSKTIIILTIINKKFKSNRIINIIII